MIPFAHFLLPVKKKAQLLWVQFQSVSWFKDHGTMAEVSETKDSSWDNTEGKNAPDIIWLLLEEYQSG